MLNAHDLYTLTPPDASEVLRERGDPSVSIYVRAGDGARARLRTLLSRASELLELRCSRAEIEALLQPIGELARYDWPSGRAVAFLRSRSAHLAFVLPHDVDDLVAVGTAFHTEPLVGREGPAVAWHVARES
jgi:hypothetical protein